MDITILDYGMGNLRSVEKAFETVGCTTKVTDRKEDIRAAEKLVIPGVGAFGDAMANLQKLRVVDLIRELISKQVPYLGICLGLQILFTTSEEKGKHRGLGILPGRVKRFPRGQKVPHMGWNQLVIKKECPLLKGINDGEFFYFVHSYFVEPDQAADILAQTDYGVTFSSMACRGNVFGMQFHPEKSQEAGLKILDNFRKL